MSDEDEVVDRTGLVVGLAAGVPLMAIGIAGIVEHPDTTPIANFLRFFAGGVVFHDALVAPLAAVVGVVVLRRAHPAVRAPLRAALFTSAVVAAIAWPALRGYGRDQVPDNTSVQPLDYGRALTLVLAVVWLVGAAWALASFLLSRRRDPAGGDKCE